MYQSFAQMEIPQCTVKKKSSNMADEVNRYLMCSMVFGTEDQFKQFLSEVFSAISFNTKKAINVQNWVKQIDLI